MSAASRLRVANKRLAANVAGAVHGDIGLNRTMDGASSLTVTFSDPDGRIRRSSLVKQASRLSIDRHKFALVGVAKSGQDLTLTAEDHIIYRLRRKRGPKKAYRNKVTRAQFAKGLVRDVDPKIRFVSPDLRVVQPIEKHKEKSRTKRRKKGDERREGGISRDAKGLKVKGAAATATQKRVAEEIIGVALRYKPPRRALLALLCAATHESVMGTIGMTSPVDHDSIGILQGRQMYNKLSDLKSIPYNVRRFFVKPWTGTSSGGAIKQANAGRSISDICTSIQGNATGDVYTQWKDEAEAWLSAYMGGSSGSEGSVTIKETKVKPYAFQVGKKENYWEALKRLAEEVGWRVFVSNDTVYFIAEPTLFKSRRRLLIGEDNRGIDSVDWDVDSGKRANTATVAARAGTWQVPPGSVVVLGKTHGPAAGRWLVASIDSTLDGLDVSVSLKRPSRPLPEPAPETVTTSKTLSLGASPSGDARPGGASGKAGVTIKNTSSGAPHWGGCAAVFHQFITPFMKKRGLPTPTTKRPYNTGSGDSDHWTGSTRAFAADYGTSSGESAARALAAALGASYSPGQWNSSTITVDGKRFSCQILWAAPDGTHYDHVHVGLHRI